MAATRPTHEAVAIQRLRRDGRDGNAVDEAVVAVSMRDMEPPRVCNIER
jgi:hypothetical protein